MSGLIHTMTDVDRIIRQKEVAIREAAPTREETEELASKKKQVRAEAVAERARLLNSSSRTAHGFVELLDAADASYEFIGNDGPVFWIRTTLNAPRGRVIAIDSRNPAIGGWRELLPEADATLENVSLVGDTFIANYTRNACSQVQVFDLSGRFVRDVDLPGIGMASGFSGDRSDSETLYSFTGYAAPPSLYRYDVKLGTSTKWNATELAFNPADYETKQIFFHSKDGTRVPMFITHKRGIPLDGSNPTLLYGYGGFSISMTPSFSTANLAWMEMGGVYAVANIRGGSEFGEPWHQAALKTKRHNAHDDFIAAAEWLVASKYTRPGRLAVQGGSQGGLLVAAVVTQRPELFGAAIVQVGVLDMVRFHTFGIGRYWQYEYGDISNCDEFAALYSYSPYHAALRRKAWQWPAIFITTYPTDQRVHPSHSYKFAAAMQSTQAGTAPILLRIGEMEDDSDSRVNRTAEWLSFLVSRIGTESMGDDHASP